jgi:hypothetical protein
MSFKKLLGAARKTRAYREEMISLVSALIPVRVVSESNLREHWAKKARRAKEQRAMARMYCQRFAMECPRGIRLTRIAPRALDMDNLAASLKHVQDGVADAAGIDDRKIHWEYAQEKGKPKEYAVRVEVIRPA